jgi:hypothetical protein
MIPEILAPLALGRLFDSAFDVPLSDVHRHRAIEQDVDSSPALPATWNFRDVFIVPCPHSSILPNDSHVKSPEFLGTP